MLNRCFLTQPLQDAMISSTNEASVDFLGDMDVENLIAKRTLNEESDSGALQINTTMSDDNVIAMEEQSPSVASPKNMLLKKTVRYKQLLDASNAFITAWINHPHLHQKALGYLVNGTNCATQSNTNGSEVNLHTLASSFSCTFGTNDSGPMFNAPPLLTNTRGAGSGPGKRKRL